MRGNKPFLCLFASVMLSSALQSHVSEQQIIQAKQHQSSSAKALSLLEVGYNMPSKPQGTGKCKGIAKMCKSSPQPEMNYPTVLDSKFVDNACFDFQSVLRICWFVCSAGVGYSFVLNANTPTDAIYARIWRGTATSLSQSILKNITSCLRSVVLFVGNILRLDAKQI